MNGLAKATGCGLGMIERPLWISISFALLDRGWRLDAYASFFRPARSRPGRSRHNASKNSEGGRLGSRDLGRVGSAKRSTV